MSEATQTAKPTDARQASMSRVVTQETILAKLAPPPAASKPDPEPKPEVPPEPKAAKAAEEPKEAPKAKPDPEPKQEVQKPETEPEPKPKKGANERIQELAHQRREAEAKAEAAESKARELEAKLEALTAQAKPMQVDERPVRSKFASEDDYIEALTDWKTKKAVADREREQAQARYEAAEAEVAQTWARRQQAVMKEFPDYADVIGASEVSVPNHIHRALLESELGPKIAYYLALNPGEAKALSMVSHTQGIKRIALLEQEIARVEAADDAPVLKVEPERKPEPKPEEKPAPSVPKSKAPPPIEPVKSVPSTTPSGASTFKEYRARRQNEQRESAAR